VGFKTIRENLGCTYCLTTEKIIMKINYKTIVVVSGIINLLLLLFLVMITLSNRRYIVDAVQKQEYSASPNQTDQLTKSKYQDYKPISDSIRTSFPEIDIEPSMSTPLIPDSNVNPFVLNEIEKKQVQSILKGLEEWEESPELGRIEITEVMKDVMIRILGRQIRTLSYEDVESQKESYQLFFQVALDTAKINNEPRIIKKEELGTIVVNFDTVEDYNKLKQLIESLKDIRVSNKESEQ